MMNDIRTAAFGLLAAVIMALLSGCNPASSDQAVEPPLAGAKIGGSFSLINQNGERVSESDLNGRYRMLYFGYSYCPDVCPVDLQRLMQGLALAEKKNPEITKKVQPVFITIDPERDRPEQLKQYVSAFHPRLIGLTGSSEEIKQVAEKYLIIYDKREDESSSEYLMDHSRQAYLFGPEGEPITLLSYDRTPQHIADEILQWVK